MHRSLTTRLTTPLSALALFTLLVLNLSAETFQNPRHIPTGSDPGSIIVADFNNDGRPDIAYGTGTNSPYSLHILLAQSGSLYNEAGIVALPANTSTFCRAFDTNRDGNQDLVCAYSSTFYASLITLLGNGDGTFAAPITTPLPASGGNYFYPGMGLPMDLNSDGIPDLIVIDSINPRAFVMLSNGHGGFTLASTINNSISTPVLAQDINGDGKPDLLFAQGPYVMLGNGDGTFATGNSYSLPFDYTNICTFADMDADGHLDAVCGYQQVIDNVDINGATHLIVLHGNPDGTFNTTPSSDKVFGTQDTEYDGQGSFLNPILVADLNHDRIPDIIAASRSGWTVLLGQSGLSFSAPVHYAAGQLASYIAFTQKIVDLNGDGSLDIVTDGTRGLNIAYGKPDGTFDTAIAYEVAQVLGHVAIADLNGDGIPDVAATGDTSIQISLGRGDGTFAPYRPLANGGINFNTPLSAANAYILPGDFNGDGKKDLFAVGSSSIYQYGAYLYLGNGNGTFQPLINTSTSLGNPSFLHLKIADLNADGRDDTLSNDTLATISPQIPNLYANLSRGDGTFQSIVTPMPVELQFNGFNAPNSPASVADFNHDGKLDAVFGSYSNIYVMPGRGDGSFDTHAVILPIPTQGVPTNTGTLATAAGDFDGDGNQDIAALYQFGNTYQNVPLSTALFVYYGNGDGTFSSAFPIAASSHAYNAITVADLDNSSTADIILQDTQSLTIFHSAPHRTFSSEVDYTVPYQAGELAALDFNRDGFIDLLVANISGNAVTVLLNNGNTPTPTGTLIATPEPSFLNQPFTLTATLTPPIVPTDPNLPATLAGNIAFSLDGAAAGSAPLSNNAATLNIAPPLTIGIHSITATWPGDANYPAVTLTLAHTVNAIPVTLNLTPSSSNTTIGQSINLITSVVNAPTAPAGSTGPIGTITLTDNGTVFATGNTATAGTIFTNSRIFTTGGTHTILASYSGDAAHPAATATTLIQVATLNTAITLNTSANPATYGTPLTFTAKLSTNPGIFLSGIFNAVSVTFTGLPTGPVTVPVTLDLPASSAALMTGTATYTTTTLPPGSYPITASFSGNTTLNPSASAPLTQVVSPVNAVSGLSISPVPAYQYQPVTISVSVTSAAITPTGTVQILDGTQLLATVPLSPTTTPLTAQVNYTTTTLTPGTHTIAAVYSGDASNLRRNIPSLNETILPSTFTLTLQPASLTLQTGHHATLTLTATSIGDFAGTIQLSAPNLPEYTTIAFTPPVLTLTAGSTTTSKLSLDTNFIIGFLSQSQPAPSSSTTARASQSRAHSTTIITAALIAPFTLMLLPLITGKSRRLPTLLAAIAAFTLLATSIGCSGKQPPTTTPGTYLIQIVGTPTSGSNQVPVTLVLPLTITP